MSTDWGGAQALALALAISTVMVLCSTLVYYEVLRFTWARLPRLHVRPRLRIIVVVIAIFAGHTAIVWLYGLVYWLLPKMHLIGELVEYAGSAPALGGVHDGSFASALYFSAATYSSLGFGDIIPGGSLRILSAVEVLNGLVLIGWSVSFTYLAMERFWGLHGGGERD